MKRAWHQRVKRLPREDRTSEGVVFDSKAEMLRWQELQMLERAGVIVNLQRQLIMPLVIGGQQVRIRSERYKHGRACIYTVDFSYRENGQRVYEESKGHDDPCSRLRRAVVEAIYGIEIRVTGAAAKHTPPTPQEAPTEPTRTRIGRRVTS